MLTVAKNIHQLRFGELMEVYAEGNLKNGRERWPELSEGGQLRRAEQEFYAYLQDTFFTTDGAFYCVWEENGRYVSALRLEPYRGGLLLEALETAPSCRRKGYASRLLTAIRPLLAERAPVKVYSHVHKKNEVSLRVHRNAGFRRIAEQAVYVDGSVNSRCCTLCLEIV